MASRGMSLKKKKKDNNLLPLLKLIMLQVAAALGFCGFWVKTEKKKKRKYAQLPLRTGFNTVYIAPVVVWKCSQPSDTGFCFGYIECCDK